MLAEPLSHYNLGYLLAKAAQRWNELLGEAFAQAGFPDVRPAYGVILVPLFDEEGLQIVELARRSGLSKQTLTTQLKALEERGLIVRGADPADRRANRIYLSERGRAFKEVAGDVLHEMDRLVAEALPTTDIERLSAALRTLADLRPATGALEQDMETPRNE